MPSFRRFPDAQGARDRLNSLFFSVDAGRWHGESLRVNFNNPNNTGIKATATRKADGWRGVLEHPNGGRQVLISQHGTMEHAEQDAAHALQVRINYPELTVKDPEANEYQDLETLTQ